MNQQHQHQQIIEIKKLVFYGTRDYHDQYARPWTTNINDQQHVNQLLEATQGIKNLDPVAMSQIAGQMVTPSSHVGQAAIIDNGWSERRLMFHMMVEVKESWRNQLTRQYISGYTNYDGVSQSGHVDPDMLLYFNSTTTVRTTMTEINGIQKPSLRIVDNTNIIAPSNESATVPSYRANSHLLRPMDVASTIYTQELLGDVFNTTVDSSTASVAGVNLSRVNNGHAPSYLSKIFSSMKASDEEQRLHSISGVESMSNMVSYTAEPLLNNNTFLTHMSTHANYGQYGRTHITFGELTQLHPELGYDNRVDVGRMSTSDISGQAVGMHNTNTLNGSSLTQIAASMLVSSLPTIISDSMFTQFGFDFTNDVVGHYEPYIVTPRAEWINSFTQGIDLSPMVDRVVTRIKTELGPILTNQDAFLVTLTVRMSLVGDTWIHISINGESPEIFSVPTWANSLFLPVVDSSESNLRSVATDLYHLMGEAQGRVRTDPWNEEDDYYNATLAHEHAADMNQHNRSFSHPPSTPHYQPSPVTPPTPTSDVNKSGGNSVSTSSLPHLNI